MCIGNYLWNILFHIILCFMKVGLAKDSMMLVYEPEAAALFCQYDFLKQQHLCDYERSYLVVDCGGGTVDIAAHKMTRKQGENPFIEELAPPSGDECGGFAVNDQFELLLQNILKISTDAFLKLKENCSVKWNNMINNDFEKSKLHFDPNNPVSLTIIIPKIIRKEIYTITGRSIEDLVHAYNSKDVEWDEDEDGVILHHPALLQLFNPVLDKIYSLIDQLLTRKDCQCVTAVLMVGGFANSKLLFESIKARLKECYPHVETFCSSDPTFSVVKGAVLTAQLKNIMDAYLQNAESTSSLTSQLGSLSIETRGSTSASGEATKYLPFVVSRKMKYSIGVETTVLFDESEHDINRRMFYAGQYFCVKVFHPLVKANESVHIGCSKKKYTFRPLKEESSKCDITIFATEKENVKYVDDADCHVRAQVVISNLPRYNTDLSREIEISIDFYQTECEISAYSVTAKEHKKITVDYHVLSSKHLPPSI